MTVSTQSSAKSRSSLASSFLGQRMLKLCTCRKTPERHVADGKTSGCAERATRTHADVQQPPPPRPLPLPERRIELPPLMLPSRLLCRRQRRMSSEGSRPEIGSGFSFVDVC